MVPRCDVDERGGAPDHGEGQERLFPGAGVAGTPGGVRAVCRGAGEGQPRHDQETGQSYTSLQRSFGPI